MKTVVLLYETCCIYEIVITHYLLQLCGHELVFANANSLEEKITYNDVGTKRYAGQ